MGLAMASPFFLFMHASFLLLCLGYGFPHVLAVPVEGRNETDRLALLAFKSAITGDPFGALNSWNESIHLCRWFGVTCGRRHQRVTGLQLRDHKLTGSISSHVANLSFLQHLWLVNNSLSSELPPELGRLRRLKYFSVLNNSITGEIPANMSSCSKLITLEFNWNRLVGKIPAELGSLTKLTFLRFGQNNLTGGMPSTFGNLSSLESLYASENSIGGSIPYSLGRLRNLKVFDLAANQLIGTIPPQIFNISSISAIDLGVNQIQGSLPSNLGNNLPNLGFLGVGSNLFTGSIPISISNATKLRFFQLTRNKFTGKVPHLGKLNGLEKLNCHGNHLGTRQKDDLRFLDSVINSTKLITVGLSENQFGGVLPESICNFSTTVTFLGLSHNEISGNIPRCVGNLINLEVFGLGDNYLRAKIPANIWNLQNLYTLHLSNNNFFGKIPSSFQNLTSLANIWLDGNNFEGSIPSSLQKCPVLWLDLSTNNLIGTIPPKVMNLSSLLSLNLSKNQLIGSLQVEIGHLINLETLDVSENMLSGKIPNTLSSCVKLTSIHMEGNNFSGSLPSSLSHLRGMVELDISHNNFSGEIPNYLEGFDFLKLLNMSFNNFAGAVPENGIFKNATAISVEGNNMLCGGITDLHLSGCHLMGFHKKRFTPTKQLIIPTSFGVLGLILGLYFLHRWWFRKRKKVPAFQWFGKPFPQLSYQTLLKATNGFSPANLVGMGRFGSVYKGLLDLDQGETVVAVKVIDLQYRGAFKSFIAECKALRSIKHRNILKVLTTCSSIDYQGNDFKALVYDLMVNGSLDNWLHPNENDVHEESRTLNLLQRLNITIDIASALDYLHHHCSEPIVHCDLKPDNVLLDSEMSAHLGDFGLTKFLLEATCDESSANQSSSIGIRGTVGYAAPEYGLGNEVSTFGDVYSYGILLLEMFTGKRPTDSMFSDGLNLHTFAKVALPDQVANIVDPMLFQQHDMGEASSSLNNTSTQNSHSSHKIHKCLVSILKVGIACSQELPTDRMDIKVVVSQLHVIRNSLLEVGAHRGRARDAV